MSVFTKRTWLARIGTGLNKFLDTVSGKNMQFDSTPDNITQEGTPLSAANLNDLESRIDGAMGMLMPLSGGTFTGAIVAAHVDRSYLAVRNIRFQTAAGADVASCYLLTRRI